MSYPIDKPTPYYYYDLQLLRATLAAIHEETDGEPHYHMHYAVKACTNASVLRLIAESGLGADCVSGGEIRACLDAGFPASKIVYAGVGKADWEIQLGLDKGIEMFNVESAAELEVISSLAAACGKEARVALRINPNVGAHTHANITTGLAENKFGIALEDAERVIALCQTLPHIKFCGLHFHIGSQLLVMDDYVELCAAINALQERLKGIEIRNINVGGGLGIDYAEPDLHPIPDFKTYFDTFRRHLQLRPRQQLHFELGRAVVGQCGTLVSRCLYVKQGTQKQFAIIDAGMTDLIRPALYGALHRVENLTSREPAEVYDVVGPICESSDVFARDYSLPRVRRGDLIALRSAGAYGEVMASQYNLRPLAKAYTSE